MQPAKRAAVSANHNRKLTIRADRDIDSPVSTGRPAMLRSLSTFVLLSPLLAACGTYHTSHVSPASTAQSAPPAAAAARPAAGIVVTENDIPNRRYQPLGDVKVTVRKATIFDTDPTRERVAEALREESARLGADAVVLARYGTVGIGFMSWGQMDGTGRAVRFLD
jgi:hypothetical protein